MPINWDKARAVVMKINALVTKYPDKIPRSDLLSLNNSIEAKNEIQFLEHITWILRALVVHRLSERDELAREILDAIRDLIKPE
jgi:hypothetical protein